MEEDFRAAEVVRSTVDPNNSIAPTLRTPKPKPTLSPAQAKQYVQSLLGVGKTPGEVYKLIATVDPKNPILNSLMVMILQQPTPNQTVKPVKSLQKNVSPLSLMSLNQVKEYMIEKIKLGKKPIEVFNEIIITDPTHPIVAYIGPFFQTTLEAFEVEETFRAAEVVRSTVDPNNSIAPVITEPPKRTLSPEQLKQYINSQLGGGSTPEQIALNLSNNGMSNEDIVKYLPSLSTTLSPTLSPIPTLPFKTSSSQLDVVKLLTTPMPSIVLPSDPIMSQITSSPLPSSTPSFTPLITPSYGYNMKSMTKNNKNIQTKSSFSLFYVLCILALAALGYWYVYRKDK
jgi:hypothetical protein